MAGKTDNGSYEILRKEKMSGEWLLTDFSSSNRDGVISLWNFLLQDIS